MNSAEDLFDLYESYLGIYEEEVDKTKSKPTRKPLSQEAIHWPSKNRLG